MGPGSLPELDAGAFAFVMATGVVSVAARLRGLPVLADALLAVAGCGWAVLAVAVGLRALRLRGPRPRLRSFAAVAATAVIGARLSLAGDGVEALALWSLAVAIWAALLLRRPTLADAGGGSLLVVVATESLAVLAGMLAARGTADVLPAALAWWLLGLLLYPLVAGRVCLALRRAPRFAPDLWIVMGALAIATLAGTEVLQAARGRRELPGWQDPVRVADLATWGIATALVVPLAAAELRARSWRFSASRWSFVFPLGMYAVASQALGGVAGVGALDEVGRAFVLVAVAAWALVAAGLVRRAPVESALAPLRGGR